MGWGLSSDLVNASLILVPVTTWGKISELMAQAQRAYLNAASALKALAPCKANVTRKQDIFFAYSGGGARNSHGKGAECLILF